MRNTVTAAAVAALACLPWPVHAQSGVDAAAALAEGGGAALESDPTFRAAMSFLGTGEGAWLPLPFAGPEPSFRPVPFDALIPAEFPGEVRGNGGKPRTVESVPETRSGKGPRLRPKATWRIAGRI